MNRPIGKILFLDDSLQTRKFFRDIILPKIKELFDVDSVECGTFEEAQNLTDADVCIAVVDYCLGSDKNGIDFYNDTRKRYLELPVIIFSAHPEVSEQLFKINESDHSLYVCEGKDWRLLQEMITNILGD